MRILIALVLLGGLMVAEALWQRRLERRRQLELAIRSIVLGTVSAMREWGQAIAAFGVTAQEATEAFARLGAALRRDAS